MRYGQKGGDSAIAGKKAQWCVSPCGKYVKRVFFGQTWMVICATTSYELVCVFPTEEQAKSIFHHPPHGVEYITYFMVKGTLYDKKPKI